MFPHVVSRSSLNDGFSKSGGLDCSNYLPSLGVYRIQHICVPNKQKCGFDFLCGNTKDYVCRTYRHLFSFPFFLPFFSIFYSFGDFLYKQQSENLELNAMLSCQVKRAALGQHVYFPKVLELAVGNTTFKTTIVQSWKGRKGRLEPN